MKTRVLLFATLVVAPDPGTLTVALTVQRRLVAWGARTHPLLLALAALAGVGCFVYVTMRRVVLPLLNWLLAPRAKPHRQAIKDEDLATHRAYMERKQADIERALQAHPTDLTQLPRIEKLTREAQALDRIVIQQLNQPAREALPRDDD